MEKSSPRKKTNIIHNIRIICKEKCIYFLYSEYFLCSLDWIEEYLSKIIPFTIFFKLRMEFSSSYSYGSYCSYSVILISAVIYKSLYWIWLVGGVFLIEAITVLCFGFVTKTLLITHHYFSWCCFKAFSHFALPTHTWLGGCTRSREGAQPGQLIQTDPVTYNVLCLAVKTEQGSLGRIPTAQRQSGHWAACGRWWLPSHRLVCFTSSSSFLCCWHFTHEFFPFALPVLSHIPLGQWRLSEQLCSAASQGTAVLLKGILKALKFEWKAAVTKPKEKRHLKDLHSLCTCKDQLKWIKSMSSYMRVIWTWGEL